MLSEPNRNENKKNPVGEIEKYQMTLDNSMIKNKVYPSKKLKINSDFKTIVLRNKRNWDSLFKGYKKMRAITYMSSPDFILNQFDDLGFEYVEVLIGEGLASDLKSNLENKNNSIERIMELITNNSLKIYGTKARVHTKMYLLSKEGETRVIIGSPNLSYNAQGTRQREYAVYWDLSDNMPNDQKLLSLFEDDFLQFMKEPDIIEFMDDLIKLCQSNADSDIIEMYQLWSRNKIDNQSIAIRAIFDQIKGQAFNQTLEENDDLIRINIPEVVKTGQKKFLSNTLGAKISGKRASINVSKYLDHRTMQGTVPMQLNEQTGEIKFGIAGEMVRVPQIVQKKSIFEGLEDIERYINTVDRAVCAHPESVKMTMMETVLFSMAAPFINLLHREKMKVTGRVNRRGPSHLLIYGPGHNGKTALGRYLNYLLTGKMIEPISGKQWGKKQWENLFSQSQIADSSFPIIVDDIKDTCFRGKRATLEGPIKSHWEENWNSKLNFPVFILNTNHEDLEEWAKTRVRRLEFNVKFKGGSSDVKLLNDLMSKENNIFAAFSKEYVSQLTKGFDYQEDELYLARKVMINLYESVSRELPNYFPIKPPEKIYDMDAISCFDKRRYGLFRERKVKGAIRLEFSSYKSKNNFKARLPPEVAVFDDDKVLVITNKDEYEKFMSRGIQNNKSKKKINFKKWRW